jgi:hypothetical protein
MRMARKTDFIVRFRRSEKVKFDPEDPIMRHTRSGVDHRFWAKS